MESHFALGVVSISEAYNQYLWVDLADGPAMLQRNWLVEPPDVSGPLSDYIEVDEQFYLNLFLPRSGGFWRLQATWMIFSQDGVPEDAALTLAVNNMTDNSDTLDTYLEGLDWVDTGARPEEEPDTGCSARSGPLAPSVAWLAALFALALRRRD